MADKIDALMDRLKKDGIKFVRFESPNILGQSAGMLVPARNSEQNGFPFCTFTLAQTINTAMALDDFKQFGYRNVTSFPDVDSYKVIAWKTLVPTASVLISQHPKYDSIYPTDCRQIALRQLHILNNKYKLDILSSIEHEFTLLNAKNEPISKPGCYRMDRISAFDVFFAKLDDNFCKMGIECDRLHSEVASGQYEITALPSRNIKGSDDAYWIKNGLREMAQQYRKWNASFITHLPLSGHGDSFNVVEDDSGAHFNHSLWIRNGSGKQNAFWDGHKNDLSKVALYWIGGIIKHVGAVTAFCCPTTICYETRFDSPWVSSEANWGRYNRTAMIRVKPSRNGKNTHFEFRLPSSLSNPYLILASVVCAGLDGIKNKILPPKELRIDIINPREREKCYDYKVPSTLNEALNLLENDKVFCKNFDPYFVKLYIKTKRLEINEMEQFKKNKTKPLFYSLM